MTTEQTAWETETGLVNDVDAWITNPKFGQRDEYMQKIAETGAEGGLMFLFDLADESGEIIGYQGYSVGTGWVVSDDGSEISHPKRSNVVGSSRYGELQNRVVKELAVDMVSRGLPTQAKSWNGLGFHWMQEQKPTVGGDERSVLMPVLALGAKPAAGAAAPAPPATVTKAPATEDATTKKLLGLVGVYDDIKDFQKAALVIPEVAGNDALMSEVLDTGPEGFWAKNKS